MTAPLFILMPALLLTSCASQTFYYLDGKPAMRNTGDIYGNVKLTRSSLTITQPSGPIPTERRYNKAGVLVAEIPVYPGVHNDRANALGKKISGDTATALAGLAASAAAAMVTGGAVR